jgi:hypothetical protein
MTCTPQNMTTAAMFHHATTTFTRPLPKPAAGPSVLNISMPGTSTPAT